MPREDQQPHKSGMRPRDPVGVHSTPYPPSQPRSNDTSALAQSTKQKADCRGAKPASVTERSWKRRKIHVVHIVVPEIEIKEEEESPSISLFDLDVDGRAELRSFFWPPPQSSTAEASQFSHYTTSASLAPGGQIQQPTPPSSPGSAADTDAASSSPTASSAASEPESTRFVAMSVPLTPSSSPLEEPTLSWPEELNDLESYKRATVSTQELIDHYLRAVESGTGMISLLPMN
ncbi:hypothetical protein C8R45DRAFT_1030525, partial [Mycena sanguinolenta]